MFNSNIVKLILNKGKKPLTHKKTINKKTATPCKDNGPNLKTKWNYYTHTNINLYFTS